MKLSNLVVDGLFVDYKQELKDILPKSGLVYNGIKPTQTKKFIFIREYIDMLYATLTYQFLNYTIPIDNVKTFKFNKYASELFEEFDEYAVDIATLFKIKFLQTPTTNIAYVTSLPKATFTREQRTYYIIYWYKLLSYMFIDVNLATIKFLPEFNNAFVMGFVFNHNYIIVQSLKDIIQTKGYLHPNSFYRRLCEYVVDIHTNLDPEINKQIYQTCENSYPDIIDRYKKMIARTDY